MLQSRIIAYTHALRLGGADGEIMNFQGYDIAVIGAGIIGLATAMRLAQEYPRYKIIVLEKDGEVAQHQTGHNSGVIHAGIYYAPGSQKANFCSTGGKLLRQFCDERGIEYEMCGKVIVAINDEEVPRLQDLYERGTANGAEGLEMVGKERLAELEPYAAGVQAIFSPNTGIIDFKEVSQAYATEFGENGGDLFLNTAVHGITRRDGQMYMETSRGEIAARHVINCAGLQADQVARMMGGEPGLRIIPFRGEYFSIREERQYLVRSLIYPVPNPSLPFLGVHFTKRVTGSVEAGPNAVLAFAREGYTKTSFSLSDTLGTFTYPGFLEDVHVPLEERTGRTAPLAAKVALPEVAANTRALNRDGRSRRAGRRRPRAGCGLQRQPAPRLRHIRDRERHPCAQRAVAGRNIIPHHQPLHRGHGSGRVRAGRVGG